MNSRIILIVVSVASFVCAAGCSREGDAPQSATTTSATDHGHDHGPGSDHSHDQMTSGAGHGGPIVELGTTNIGPFTVRASRDAGDITPGGDAPIDVWLTGTELAKVAAVRFWIGTKDGDNFVKAKANIEDPAEANRWHTHAEVPSPLPADIALWVEIEVDGQKNAGSFDLKR